MDILEEGQQNKYSKKQGSPTKSLGESGASLTAKDEGHSM